MFFITAPTKAEVRELLSIGQSKLSDVTTEGADQGVLTWHVTNTANHISLDRSMDGLSNLQHLLRARNRKVGELNMENLVDSSIVQKMDGSGFFEKPHADYGVK